MEFRIHKFPELLNDSRVVVEELYCELLNRYRSGEGLDPEELDWMDSANSWLTTG